MVPEEKELINPEDDGIKYPIDIPIAIAKKIHSVKYLSKKLNFFLSYAGAQLFVLINFLEFIYWLDIAFLFPYVLVYLLLNTYFLTSH